MAIGTLTPASRAVAWVVPVTIGDDRACWGAELLVGGDRTRAEAWRIADVCLDGLLWKHQIGSPVPIGDYLAGASRPAAYGTED